jgi:hypothetical protein
MTGRSQMPWLRHMRCAITAIGSLVTRELNGQDDGAVIGNGNSLPGGAVDTSHLVGRYCLRT